MQIEIKENAKKVFENWFEHFAKSEELFQKERLFEFFHSGYIAGTRFDPAAKKTERNPNIIQDDINRNLDL